MPRSRARLSASASSHRNLSSAVFITNIAESDFSVHTGGKTPAGAQIVASVSPDFNKHQRTKMINFLASFFCSSAFRIACFRGAERYRMYVLSAPALGPTGSPPSSEATSSWSTNCGKDESAHKKTGLHDKLDQQLRLWVYGRIERLYPCDVAIPS
jgi:hypothetical protein